VFILQLKNVKNISFVYKCSMPKGSSFDEIYKLLYMSFCFIRVSQMLLLCFCYKIVFRQYICGWTKNYSSEYKSVVQFQVK